MTGAITAVGTYLAAGTAVDTGLTIGAEVAGEGAFTGAVADAGLAGTAAAIEGTTAATTAATAGLTGFQELSLGASALSGLGSLGTAAATQKSAEYNAAIAGNNATIASQNATTSIQEGEANAAAASQSSKAKIGGILANQGASGVDVNSGSSLETRASAADVGELNAINIRSQAARTAYGFETSGVNDTAEQNMYQSQAAYAPIQGAIGAGTSLLSGAAAVNSPWASLVAGNGLGGNS